MTRLMSGVFALVALVAGGYAVMGWQASAPTIPENLLVGAANAQEAADIDTSTIVEMVQGAEDAPITLIEYASFTCPHCANFHAGPYKQIKADYIDTGKVKFIFREVYFDRYGLWASMVARCSGPEKFFGITDLIMKGQSEWARAGSATEIVDGLRKIGRLAGTDSDQLEACLMDSNKAQTLVTWYQEHATADGVESTPSFIMNGKKVENQAYEDFKKLLDAELEG
ncbi:DsbA family protein [Aliisedimentitalea scapharcae]|uniref:DsbA family protein n=1 Tax=Aliisedimentitalea scapharcae TaxID=1524259 RepID=A0ABZ2XU04_9RHOB|nr:DsbA family protein [Rhodobacteraceae bacterium M382]